MAMEPGKELLWKYVFGQCEPNEVAFVENWIKENPENQKTLDRIRLYESVNELKGGSLMGEQDKLEEIKDEKPYSSYIQALLIIVLVFILLTIYSFIKK